MPDDNDLSIEHIVRLANKGVCDVISTKIGRSLTSDEANAISAVIGSEHFWARAEELLIFVRHNSTSDVANAMAMLATRFREGSLTRGEESLPHAKRVNQCDMCNSTGAVTVPARDQGPPPDVQDVVELKNVATAMELEHGYWTKSGKDARCRTPSFYAAEFPNRDCYGASQAFFLAKQACNTMTIGLGTIVTDRVEQT